VICAARDVAGAGETAALIRGTGGRSTAIELDVSDPASVDALLPRLPGPAIDVLVNNAGVASVPLRVTD
jgi:NAD(P)-dependent dehydrogenase (short-subunit alcohol dehydrogenase family)